ncbi:hypothetical protein D8674_032605 [Pyrus ussuriensis x Pyrus communis]|uniref:Uncharacterized protein n=1 Tax=Pyrus ussuriensis x Pyrus communis TaxID=2448454 RepID=A0A5N5HQI5_9ROSA|nr:hypothetical protein D8674_032605 [Pyrus ussuriensis x Pyrus communis]
MTYDPTDLSCDIVPLRRNITNANGVTSLDILTKEIIGRGTKRGDLYFVDDVSTGRVNLAQRAVDHKRRQIRSCYIRASTIRFGAPTKGYRCYHPPSCRMYTTMDVIFSESEMYYSSASSNPPFQGETLHDEKVWTMAAATTDLPLPLLGKPVMVALPTQPREAALLPTELAVGTTVPCSPWQQCCHLPILRLLLILLPLEALCDDPWTKAMEEEMDALQKNQTWDLVLLPRGKKRVGCRWVYTIKYKADGSIERYKARLVAKGYTQTYGVDYTETFAPVAKINTVPDGYEEVWVQAEQFRSYTFLEMLNGPDIAYAVSVVSQFMHSPSEAHIGAVERILRCLKSSPGREGYTDADWAGNVTDRRSTSSYFTFVGGNLAEYRGMAKGVCELLWLQRLLGELGYSSNSALDLFCDNKAAIDISHNPIQHDRTKHVEVDRHFIKEKLDGNIIQFPFVKSEDQLADILTKTIASQVFYNSLVKLGMNDIYAPT